MKLGMNKLIIEYFEPRRIPKLVILFVQLFKPAILPNCQTEFQEIGVGLMSTPYFPTFTTATVFRVDFPGANPFEINLTFPTLTISNFF